MDDARGDARPVVREEGAMHARLRPQAAGGLVAACRHELYKGRRQPFYRRVVLTPLVLAPILVAVLAVIKIVSPPAAGIPTISAGADYDLGPGGAFAFANTVLFSGLGSLYVLVLILAAILAVTNEYRWNTIKMLAIREPSRVMLVLSKALFALAVVGGSALAFVAAWAILALVLKVFYQVPLALSADDGASIGAGLHYFGLTTLHTAILALLAVALAFHFRSLVGPLIGYLLYNAVDSQVSRIGALMANGGMTAIPDWARPLLDGARLVQPFLLTSSVNRLAMRAQILPLFGADGAHANPQIVLSTPVWWAATMLVVYAVLFAALAVAVFAPRDITD